MDAATFNEILAARLAKTKTVLAVKADEYAANHDRLHNFKRASGVLGCSPARACVGFMTKHLVSVMDMVDFRRPSPAMIDEKVGDAVNYLILLEALLIEEQA